MADDSRENEIRDAAPDPDEIDRKPTSEREGPMASIQRAGADPKKLVLTFAIFAAAIFMFFALIDGVRSDADLPETPPSRRADSRIDPDTIIAPTLGGAASDPDAPIAFGDEQVPGFAEAPPSAGPPVRDGPPPKSERQLLAEASRRSGLIAYGGQSGLAAAIGNPLGGGAVSGQRSDTQAGNSREPTVLDGARRASAIGRQSARAIGDRNYLLTAGTHIPCVLQTAMDSSVPGYVSCIVPRHIYSDNGRVVLLEKGTRVLGEYQGGLNRGQYRLFVLWNRALTPRGIAIDLASPASDALGRAGLSGGVDTFFWERFGTALLFSLVEDASVIASERIGGGGDNVTRVPSDTASTIVQDSQQIRPVLRKNQGEDVGIFVAQDFDFADVYDLRIK